MLKNKVIIYYHISCRHQTISDFFSMTHNPSQPPSTYIHTSSTSTHMHVHIPTELRPHILTHTPYTCTPIYLHTHRKSPRHGPVSRVAGRRFTEGIGREIYYQFGETGFAARPMDPGWLGWNCWSPGRKMFAVIPGLCGEPRAAGVLD